MPSLELEMLAKVSHSYYVNFDECSRTRKNFTQSVPNLVWRKVYGGFHKEFSNIASQEKTLKERLRDALNSTKTCTCNEQGTRKAIPQYDEIL